jgi:hypothetical protein
MTNIKWTASDFQDVFEGRMVNPAHYEAEGHRYFLSIDLNEEAFDGAGGWDVEIGAVVPASRTDDAYDITVDCNQFFDLQAAKLWAEFVDLNALAEDFRSESVVLENDSIEAHERGY